jgi:phosphopantetheinyl transferase (holo-ACP synthase)
MSRRNLDFYKHNLSLGFAKIWAYKEAVIKATGGLVYMLDIEITHNIAGNPAVRINQSEKFLQSILQKYDCNFIYNKLLPKYSRSEFLEKSTTHKNRACINIREHSSAGSTQSGYNEEELLKKSNEHEHSADDELQKNFNEILHAHVTSTDEYPYISAMCVLELL